MSKAFAVILQAKVSRPVSDPKEKALLKSRAFL